MTAVLVAHDGARWLPETLEAVARQSRPAQRLVAVDTGSRDESPSLLAQALGDTAVLQLPRTTGFGDAVRAGLAAFAGMPDDTEPAGPDGGREWIWLLHDDGAPDREALAAMLTLADSMPSAAVIGAKSHAWSDPEVITEAGFTIDRGGRRETGLEPGELDQGQRDGITDVLAVGTAGLLVRRDVWDELGGLDPALPLFRDDLDFCLRAHLAGHRVVVANRAVIRHAAAASSGLRAPDVPGGRSRALDRYGALYAMLSNTGRRGFALGVPRLLLGSLLRALLLLVGKRPGDAVDELHAALRLVRNLPHVFRVRAVRGERRTVGPRQLRQLYAGPGAWLRHYTDAVARAVQRLLGETTVRRRGVETGPTELGEDVEFGAGVLRRTLSRPGVLLVVGLGAVALIADRGLFGGGLLQGGGLLPAPDGASDWWGEFAASWHPVGPGTSAAAPPYVAVLGLLASICFGKAWFVVDVILLGAVPLAGLSAYLAAGRVTSSVGLRVWAATAYALLPAVTGAVSGGRLGAAVAIILLPLVLVAAARVMTVDPRGRWRRAWGAGLLFAVASAFDPLLYVVAVPLLLGVAAALRISASPARRGSAMRRAGAAAIITVVPLVLLLPWTVEVVHRPSLLLGVAGMPLGILRPAVSHPGVLFALWPGGPGLPPAWIYLPILAAGLAGLVRLGGRSRAQLGWTLTLGGLAAALIVSRWTVALPAGDGRLTGWAGVPTAVMATGLLLSALVAADGARQRLERKSFSWRQPLAGVVAGLAALVPLASGLAWLVRGAEAPLDRMPATRLPAFVAADLDQPERPAALVVRPGPDGSVRFALQSAGSPRLGQGELTGRGPAWRALNAVVADLAAGRGGTTAPGLSGFGIRYVALPHPATATGLVRSIDAVAGLSRESATGDVAVWKLAGPGGRLRVLPASVAGAVQHGRPPDVPTWTEHPAVALPVGGSRLRSDGPGRLLVLSALRDGGWQARLDGRPLRPATAYGWAQAWHLPASGGTVHVDHSSAVRAGWLAGEGVLLALAILLALPPIRRPGADPTNGTPSRVLAEETVA